MNFYNTSKLFKNKNRKKVNFRASKTCYILKKCWQKRKIIMMHPYIFNFPNNHFWLFTLCFTRNFYSLFFIFLLLFTIKIINKNSCKFRMSKVQILEGFRDLICGKSSFSQSLVYQHKKSECTGGCAVGTYVPNLIVYFPIYTTEGKKHTSVT